MIKKITGLYVIAFLITVTTFAQEKKADTVVVSLGKSSKVIFTVGDRSDLEVLKHYNFQELFLDVIKRIQESDSLSAVKIDSARHAEIAKSEEPAVQEDSEDDDDDDEDWSEYKRGRIGRTWQSFNFDLGTNNYLTNGKFPDNENASYAVRPWGSWYLAASSIQRTRVGQKVFLEWGIGMSWYTFKFQNDNTMIAKTDDGIEFIEDTRDVNHIKSKLSASYINASLVPVIDFGGYGKKPRMWDGYQNAFRIGLGPYIGYRIASHSKLVYKDDSDREKEKQRNNLYLNNFRYGARLQLGFRSTDFFFNYDFNELFASGKGPKLNAFSFGVIF